MHLASVVICQELLAPHLDYERAHVVGLCVCQKWEKQIIQIPPTLLLHLLRTSFYKRYRIFYALALQSYF